MANEQNLKPFTGKDDPRNGRKPKGAKHLSTWIQQMLNDEDFEANILDAKTGIREYKGAPIKAIVGVAMIKAVNGDDKSREWLAKYGFGQKFEVEHSGEIETGSPDSTAAALYAAFLKQQK